MKTFTFLLSIFIVQIVFANENDSIKTYRHIPFGVTFNAGFIQQNFNNLNTSDTLLANVNSLHSNFGTGFYFGNREKLFCSVNISSRHYSNPVVYTYYNSFNNAEQTSKGNSIVINGSYEALLYKAIFSKKRTTIFAYGGETYSKSYFKIYKKDFQSINGLSSQITYKVIQNCNLNLGFMFDFFKTEAISNYLSVGFKIGYTIPLTKSQWFIGNTKINNAPSINMGGPYASLVWNLF